MRRAVSALHLVASRAGPLRARSQGRIEPGKGEHEHEHQRRVGGWLRRRGARTRSWSADGATGGGGGSGSGSGSGRGHFPWLALPEALRYHIVAFLDRRSIAALACVSTATRAFAGSDVVWRRLYRETFRSPPPKSHASTPDGDGTASTAVTGDRVTPLYGSPSSGPGRLRSATAPSSAIAAAAAAARDGRVGGVPPWHVTARTPRSSADDDDDDGGAVGAPVAQADGGGGGGGGSEPLARRLSRELAAVATPPRQGSDASTNGDANAVPAAAAAGGAAAVGGGRGLAPQAPSATGPATAPALLAPPSPTGATAVSVPAAASLPGMVVSATVATTPGADAHGEGGVGAGGGVGAAAGLAAGGGVGAAAAGETRGATPLLEWMQRTSWRPVDEFAQFQNYQLLFKERLEDPAVGDGVQVLWEGSFNLVSAHGITGYEGRAWWEAAVVDKDGDEYKIHYPQWDSALWDEWVTRDRIRWPPAPETDPQPLLPGDVVEMRCTSSSGRSPWLESVVLRVDGDRHYVGNVVITGDKSVSRKALRFVRRPPGATRYRSSLHLGRHRCAIM